LREELQTEIENLAQEKRSLEKQVRRQQFRQTWGVHILKLEATQAVTQESETVKLPQKLQVEFKTLTQEKQDLEG